jgi:hypothetical protein
VTYHLGTSALVDKTIIEKRTRVLFQKCVSFIQIEIINIVVLLFRENVITLKVYKFDLTRMRVSYEIIAYNLKYFTNSDRIIE